MKAKAKVRKLPYLEASETSTPLSWVINPGITGIIIPRPITSISSVKKIKPIAAFLPEGIYLRLCRNAIAAVKKMSQSLQTSAFQTIDQIHIFLHGSIGSFTLLFLPGIVFGCSHKIEWIRWCIAAGIPFGSLLIQRIQL